MSELHSCDRAFLSREKEPVKSKKTNLCKPSHKRKRQNSTRNIIILHKQKWPRNLTKLNFTVIMAVPKRNMMLVEQC